MGYKQALLTWYRDNANLFVVFLILLGSLAHLWIIFPSGSYLCLHDHCGLAFWGVHNHDSMWHLAVAKSAFSSFPWIFPTFAGASLSGYNNFIDFLIWVLSLAGISPLFTFFKLIPVITVFFLVYFILKITKLMQQDKIFLATLLVFVFFGSSFSYFIKLHHEGVFTGSAGMLSMQSILNMTNLQFAISIPLSLWMILIVAKKQRAYSLSQTFKLALIGSITLALKFYSIIIIAPTLIFYLYKTWKSKGVKQALFSVLISTGILFGMFWLFYQPNLSNLTSKPTFVFSPFTMVHSMIEEPSLLFMPDMVNARYSLYAIGWSFRLIAIEIFTSLLFLFFNMGFRFYGLIYVLIMLILRRLKPVDNQMIIIFSLGVLLPIFFIQSGIWWNTIQFFYYALFFANFFIARLVADIAKFNIKLAYFCLIVMFVSMLPYNFDAIKGYFDKPSIISKQELEALDFLSRQPKGVVFNNFKLDRKLPWAYFDYQNSYVTAISGQQTYLADPIQLELLNIDYKKRLLSIEKSKCKNILNEIDYIYYVKDYDAGIMKKCNQTISSQFRRIFSNKIVSILQKR